MAEQSKFSGALARLNQRPEEPAKESPVLKIAAREVAPEKAKGGRPFGKRSDPDFQQTTLLLRKATKKRAVRKLEDTSAKLDLSELVEQLLTEWNARQA